MTLYRLLQESLSNGYRHAQEKSQSVYASVRMTELYIEVVDEGPRFDPQTVPTNGHFGLIGRERSLKYGRKPSLKLKTRFLTFVTQSLS